MFFVARTLICKHFYIHYLYLERFLAMFQAAILIFEDDFRIVFRICRHNLAKSCTIGLILVTDLAKEVLFLKFWSIQSCVIFAVSQSAVYSINKDSFLSFLHMRILEGCPPAILKRIQQK